MKKTHRNFTTKLAAALLAVMFIISAIPASAQPITRSEWDVWHAEGAQYVAELGSPRKTHGGVTRGMLPVIIARSTDADVSPFNAEKFGDVPSGTWYSTAVNWAAERGIVEPMSDGVFAPNAEATGDEISSAVNRIAVLRGLNTDVIGTASPFAALSDISSWANGAVKYIDAFSDGETADSAERTSAFGERLASAVAAYVAPAAETRAVTSISLDRTSFEIEAGQMGKLSAALKPENTSEKPSWVSSDTSVAIATSDGGVIGISEGYATVGAVSSDGTCASYCVVKVNPAPVKDDEPASKRTIDPSLPMIAITYDDGPGKFTDQILDTLEQYGAVATFFELGQNVKRWPDVIKREVELGCEIASHTWNHPKLTTLSSDAILEQITSTNAAFVETVGFAPTLLRPPYGAHDDTVDAIAKGQGMKIIRWSVDTEDWALKDSEKIIDYIRNHAYDGAIILVHSIHDFTAEATKTFVPELIANGYQLVTVSEMAEARGVQMTAGETYYSFKP